jgi:hypothetical protein
MISKETMIYSLIFAVIAILAVLLLRFVVGPYQQAIADCQARGGSWIELDQRNQCVTKIYPLP